jgi:hypothetical protein
LDSNNSPSGRTISYVVVLSYSAVTTAASAAAAAAAVLIDLRIEEEYFGYDDDDDDVEDDSAFSSIIEAHIVEKCLVVVIHLCLNEDDTILRIVDCAVRDVTDVIFLKVKVVINGRKTCLFVLFCFVLFYC